MPAQLSDVTALLDLLEARDQMKRENYVPVKRYPETASLGAPYRSYDGSGTHKRYHDMGKTGEPFMRNVPLNIAQPDPKPNRPDPRTVAKNLLHPEGPQKLAKGVNILCAAWIQFQVHDWFEHRKDQSNRI
ncbi:MAG: peroxidase family protein, partial [Pseudomonadota bacterium]